MRVVVLGGYGNFGARICRALVRDGMEVIAAARDPDRHLRETASGSKVGKVRLDISDADLDTKLHALTPGLVIHCVGPFQGQDYRVAKAVLAAGAHYIDLADGRSFVANFGEALDPIAKAAKRLAVTGASTLPTLSSAIVDALLHRFSSLEDIQTAIAPAHRSLRGMATVKAVFSYLGEPFKWMTDGQWVTAYGWQDLRRLRFAGIGARWAAACDVPDLELFPRRYSGVRTVQFRAALEFGIEHFVLAMIAGLRRFGIRIPLQQWAAAIDRVACQLDRFGGERGGMLISLVGIKPDGRKSRIEWHLTADSEYGPEIPCMPAILLAQKLARNELTIRGAVPCMGLLTLDEFSPEFARWKIETQIEETAL